MLVVSCSFVTSEMFLVSAGSILMPYVSHDNAPTLRKTIYKGLHVGKI